MEAIDTVMSNEETAHIIFESEGTAKEAWHEVNKAQAEISFKAGQKYALSKEGHEAISYLEGHQEGEKQGSDKGRKEVVEWLKTELPFDYKLLCRWDMWHKQLKEWGL